MLLMKGKNLCKYYGSDLILEDINFQIISTKKIGVVGVNGAGKTSLFKILAGEEYLDSGEIYFREGKKLGYLKQLTRVDSESTLYEECLNVFSSLIEMENQLRLLEEEISNAALNDSSNLNSLMNNYSKLTDDFEEQNGYGYKSEIRGVLKGLGFNEDEFDRPVNSFSGGQKSRLALAKILLEGPDLLLLDEPTNHLDIDAINWLTNYIKAYNGAALIISHNRYFLEEVIDEVFLIENKKLHHYRMGYEKYIKQRKKDREIYKRQFENQQEEIKRQKEIIERYSSYGSERYNRLAKSRQKLLDKMEVMDELEEQVTMKLDFEPKVLSGREVIKAEGLSKAFDGVKIFENINFDIYRGDKIGLIGPNGVGKTTLFNILLGNITDYGGDFKTGTNVNIDYFDQEMADLDDTKTVIDEIWEENSNLKHTEIRNLLSRFMFIGDEVFKEIKDLSGGEKGRLALLKMMTGEGNFLLLDEPTNHLDIESKDVLEEALKEYTGTILTISHDRYFLNQVVDKIFVMEADGITEYLGNYNYYLEKTKVEEEEEIIKTTRTEERNKKRREREKLESARKERKILEKLEEEIHIKEAELNEIENTLSLNETYEDNDLVMALNKERETLIEEINELFSKWVEMEGI